VTDREIREAAKNGANTLEALSRQLQVATCCGRCLDCALNLLDSIAEEPLVSNA
jgi:bacterioferritin-associated ferredoxin